MTEKNNSTLLVKAELKRRIVAGDHQTAGDFPDALEKMVDGLVQGAMRRAKENGRKQVRPCDL